jgi:hypothetical protein
MGQMQDVSNLPTHVIEFFHYNVVEYTYEDVTQWCYIDDTGDIYAWVNNELGPFLIYG